MLVVIVYFAKSFKVTRGHWKQHHQIDRIRLILAFRSTVTRALFCIVSEIQRDIYRKSQFFYSHAFDAPVRESPSEYCRNIWCEKQNSVVKSLTICLAVSTQYGRVTDRQTDRQASYKSIVRAMRTSTHRAAKTNAYHIILIIYLHRIIRYKRKQVSNNVLIKVTLPRQRHCRGTVQN